MKPYSSSAGFTLLEILLVAFLMGLAATAVVFSVSSGGAKSQLEQEVKRFIAVVELLSEEAIMSGTDYGVLVDKGGYSFVQLDTNDHWQPFEEGRIFKAVDLSQLATITLTLEGFSWDGSDKSGNELGLFSEDLFEEEFIDEGDEEEKRLQPQIFLFSSGEMSAFTLAFELIESEQQAPLFKAAGLSSGQLMLLRPEDEKWRDY